MKNKFILLIFTLVFLFNINAKADEGMWFLSFIGKNYSEMKSKGFNLSVEDIYSINKSCMKDAVVSLDYGDCTAELISEQGLLLTNHHCGYGEIQAHSTVEKDYLTNGFWAMTKEDELPNPGKTASFFIRIENVTRRILSELKDDMKEEMREKIIKNISEEIECDAIVDTHYEAKVYSFFGGNDYYLIVYEVFKDIRLVGAPPESIGKYGYETDNWRWPRHTGDFCFFRVYSAPDGTPAEYSPNNIPYVPKYSFPISLEGIKENDFAMVMGYPASTNRYLTSWEVQQLIEHENDIRVEVRTKKIEIFKKHMLENEKIRIQYAAKLAQCSNNWIYSIGQNKSLKKFKVLKRKKLLQKKLTKWINQDYKRLKKYGKALDIIKYAITDNSNYNLINNYWLEAFYHGSEIQQFALANFALIGTFGVKKLLTETCDNLRTEGEIYFQNYNTVVDRELLITMFELFKKKVEPEYHPDIFKEIEEEYYGDLNKFADDLYSKSFLTNKKRYMEFLENPNERRFNNDIGIRTAMSIINLYWDIIDKKEVDDYNLIKGKRLFIAAYLEMLLSENKNALFYPDANSTMRLSYGQVGGYKADGKIHNFTTNLNGYMKKEKQRNKEFFVSEKLKELHKAKDYGRYADKNGNLITCFITNNDISGGNSGSPVINGNGELIGVAFDKNWEAMSGDIAFETELQKTICVDIRFVLFIVDKYAGASNLINEMNIINN